MKIEHRNSGEELELKLGDGAWFKLLSPPTLSQSQSETLCQWLASLWDKFPNGKLSALTLPKVFSQPTQDTVCFYPGSFSPWHEGHQECVRQTSDKMQVIVIPDANPWKNQEQRKMGFNEVLEIAKTLPSQCHLYVGFVHLNSGNPTSSWLSQTNWPKRYLCVGEDSFLGLSKWKNVGVLLDALTGLFVIPRKTAAQELLRAETEIKKINKNLVIQMMSHHDYEEVSSSEIRKLETP
mgnify:CR=1 FL=1|tara:strand:+ start:27423 stop:28133 length:711 start_codon:yes stop_codon:yes gene_type:complete